MLGLTCICGTVSRDHERLEIALQAISALTRRVESLTLEQAAQRRELRSQAHEITRQNDGLERLTRSLVATGPGLFAAEATTSSLREQHVSASPSLTRGYPGHFDANASVSPARSRAASVAFDPLATPMLSNPPSARHSSENLATLAILNSPRMAFDAVGRLDDSTGGPNPTSMAGVRPSAYGTGSSNTTHARGHGQSNSASSLGDLVVPENPFDAGNRSRSSTFPARAGRNRGSGDLENPFHALATASGIVLAEVGSIFRNSEA